MRADWEKSSRFKKTSLITYRYNGSVPGVDIIYSPLALYILELWQIREVIINFLPKAVAKTLANEIKVRTPFAIYIKVKIGPSKIWDRLFL